MLHSKSKKESFYNKNLVSYICLSLFLGIALNFLFNTGTAEAVDCNGTLTSEDCPHQDISTYTGRYRTVIGGDGTYPRIGSGSAIINVPACISGPATIIKAELSWAGRGDDLAFWDNEVDVSVDSGTAATITQYRRYKSDPGSDARLVQSGDITSIVLPGSHTYDVSGLDYSGSFGASDFGFGIHVIYECSEFSVVDITQKDGLDLGWWQWSAWADNRSELICESTTAHTSARTITIDTHLPGAADANREADLWYVTGAGTAPGPTDYDLLSNVTTPANGGQVLQRLVMTSDDPEWDTYQGTITLAAGDEWVCIQADASFRAGQHPDDAAANGASMFTGGLWVSIPQATVTHSLGSLVWEDTNNNGLVDGGESGICGVDVHLYAEVGGDQKYNAGDEGTTPLQTTTTSCAGTAGEYLFTGLAAGDYILVIPQQEFDSGELVSYVSSTGSNGSATGAYEAAPDPDNDIDNDDNGYTISGVGVASCAATLSSGAEPTSEDADDNTNLTVDFGFFNDAKLGDFIWYDTNNNGAQDSGEAGVPGVTATLYDSATNTALESQVTDENGGYMFCYLIAGSYYIEFTNLPSSYALTSQNDGSDGSDSDADPTTGRTAVYVLGAGEVNISVDGGLVAGELAATGAPAAHIALVGSAVLLLTIVSSRTTQPKVRRIEVTSG